LTERERERNLKEFCNCPGHRLAEPRRTRVSCLGRTASIRSHRSGDRDYSVYQLDQGDRISVVPFGRPPDEADLIYCFRPLSELREIIRAAQLLRAKSLWMQSGASPTGDKDPKGCWLPEEELRSAQKLAEAAGLNFFCEPYIGDVAREIKAGN